MELHEKFAASGMSTLIIVDALIRALDRMPGFSRAEFIAQLRRVADMHVPGGGIEAIAEELRWRIDVLAAEPPEVH